jgi:hypothetical protein
MGKKNLLKIPPEIIARIKAFGQDDVVVACAKLVQNDQVQNYAALHLMLEDGQIAVPEPFLPNPSAGRYSHTNVEGKEVKRKDLPMYMKSFPIEAPSWNSGSTHTIWHDRMVYQRDWIAPKGVLLHLTIAERRDGGSVVKFAVDEVINRQTPKFEEELLFNLNILQENLGTVDVFPSAATLAEYAATVRVDWELLPPGTSVDQIIASMKQRGIVDAPTEAVVRQRLAVMNRLRPESYVIGTTNFARYFGAKFGEDFVAFENIRYGNAIYIMRENWRTLSQKSRIELMTGKFDEIIRIEHRHGWDDIFSAWVHDYRQKLRKKLI